MSTPIRVTYGAAAAAAVLVITACGADDAAETTAGDAADGGRSVQVLTFNSDEQMQPLMDAWKAEHPDVALEFQSVPFDELNSIVQNRVGAGDTDVDVYLVDQPRLASLASQDLLLDLTDHVDVPDGAVLSDALEATTYGGGLYALPVQTSTQMLFYNPELLADADVQPPSTAPNDRWTWEDVVSAAEAAQVAGATWGLLFEQGATPYQLQPLAESLGGGPGLTGPDLSEPAITTDGWIEAMTWFAALHENELAPRGMGFGVTTETFAAGEAAFLLAGPWNLGILDGMDLDFDYGVAPHPYFAGGDVVTPTGSFGWGVNPASDNVDDAIALVEYVALDPEGSLAVAEGDPNIPTQAEALDEYLSGETFQRGDGATVGELIRYELENTARLRPISPAYIAFETIVGSALEDIRNGVDVVTSLESAEADLRAQLGG